MTPWTATYQAPPSMGFSRQEYWSGVLLPSAKVILSVYIYIYIHTLIYTYILSVYIYTYILSVYIYIYII